jgi:Protein of unknown function (DUF732)
MALNRMALGTVGLAVTLAAFAGVPVASAEPRDMFLDELATLNVYIPDANGAATVAAGNQVCDELRAGTSVLDEMSRAEEIFRLPSGQGTLFVSAATTNLCPDFAAG